MIAVFLPYRENITLRYNSTKTYTNNSKRLTYLDSFYIWVHIKNDSAHSSYYCQPFCEFSIPNKATFSYNDKENNWSMYETSCRETFLQFKTSVLRN